MTNNIRAAGKTEPSGFAIEATGVAFDVESKAADGTPKRPTFSIVGYTGAVMTVSGFYTPVIVDLAGLKAESQQIPALRDHDHTRIVGQTNSIKIDATGVRLDGNVTGDNADATEVTSQAKNGFKWKASIGANIDERVFLEAGKKATVNGQEVTGPMVIARRATLGEISFVAIGADNKTSANVAASLSSGTLTGASSMFENWLKAKGIDPALIDTATTAALQAMFDAETAKASAAAQTALQAAGAGANGNTNGNANAGANGTGAGNSNGALTANLDQILKAQRDEEFRITEITRITAEAISRRPALIDEFERIAKSAIESKSTVADFELASLRLRANAAPSAHTGKSGGGSGIRANQSIIEAALCKAGRLPNLEKHFDERTLEASDKAFRHGIGLQELLLIGAQENGYTGRTASDIAAVLRAAFDIKADGGFSNINIPGTLSNVMNKFLVDNFNAVESAWREITSVRTVRDFKQISSYSLTGDLQYELVGATGELKSGSLGEAKYTNQAATYGKLLAISRQDIINDDLGALMRVPQRLGRGAGLKLNDVIWTTFLAGVGSFWASGNANLITGATTTLTAVGLTTALLKFRQQTDPDGKPLGLTPATLLVSPENEVTAKQLMNSTYFNTGGSSTTAQVPQLNTWAGSYKVAASTYLSNSSYTGYSTTAWWLLANPADLPTIELAVLNGREVPVIESAEADFSTLGIQVRGFHDFGASLQEQRGSVRSAGA